LGLATVYGIVSQSGGEITVQSEPSRGTTFRIYLPHERTPIDHVRPLLSSPVGQSNSETVLVVEDDDAVRELVCNVLEENGYEVLCAADAASAISMTNRFDANIDLLISDVIMPNMNGPELASILSVTRPGMKVLFVSGYSANDIGDHGVLRENVQLLQKPFSPQTILQRMREVFATGPAWSERSADTSQLELSI
jgi:DNA-binding response OmpR family regulator